MARIRSHLTFANVVSLTALFIALGGGAYALSIPKNSIGAKELKRNAVTGPKLKRGAVTSSKVRDRALLAKDFKSGELPAGAPGARGEKGEQGAPGVSGLQQVFESSAVNVDPSKLATATCPPGKRAIGGGATHSNAGAGEIVIDQIQPSDEDTVPGVVTVSAHATGGPSWSVTAFALCANVS